MDERLYTQAEIWALIDRLCEKIGRDTPRRINEAATRNGRPFPAVTLRDFGLTPVILYRQDLEKAKIPMAVIEPTPQPDEP